MDKEFIPYKQALELKELGFDEECLDCYNHKGNLWGMRLSQQSSVDGACLAPLYQQAFRFFRQEHNLVSWIYSSDVKKYFFTILQNGRIVKANEVLLTYEEAELACLKKLIEIVKNK